MALSVEEIKSVIPQLLQRAPKPPEEIPEYEPGPATLDDIRKFEAEKGMLLSRDVIEWLMTTNGIFRGPGKLYGVSGWMAMGMEGAFASHPEWRTMKWFPLAGDGCGNNYVSYPSDRFEGRRPVCFVDMIKSPNRIDYIVASSAWHFIYFLLNRELGDKRWPFMRDYVLAQDPDIQEFTELPMPWIDRLGSPESTFS